MFLSRCGDCHHREICKHREEYEGVVRDINVKVPEPFTLVLNCKHYYSTCTYLNACDYTSTESASNSMPVLPTPGLNDTFVY